jgi:hypothetical protein
VCIALTRVTYEEEQAADRQVWLCYFGLQGRIWNVVEMEQEGLDGADNNSDDSESDFDDNIEPETRDNIVALCRQMEHVGMTSTDPLGAELANLARKFRGLVVQRSIRESKQTALDGWTTKATTTTKGKETGG